MTVESPPSVERFIRYLEDRGYELREDTYSYEAFGNVFKLFEKDDTAIYITRDRSLWAIKAGPVIDDEGGSWATIWQDYFAGRYLGERDLEIDWVCDYFTSHMDDIERAIRQDPHLRGHLEECHKWSAAGRGLSF